MRHADKALHFAGGAFITFVFGLIHPTVGLAVCAAVAVAKEEYDRRHPASHTIDGWDAYATLLGAVIGQAALILITRSALNG